MSALAALLLVVTLCVAMPAAPRLAKVKRRRLSLTVDKRGKSKDKPRKKKQPEDLGMIVSEVATRLRSGERTEQAWKRTLERAGFEGQWELDDHGVPQAMRKIWNARGPLGNTRKGTLRTGVPAAVAVCRMSRLTGAPTADILDSCARGITEAGEATAAREVALAGPKASARMLSWLPLMGIGFGTIIGAQPLAFLTGEIVGYMCLALGGGLEIIGVLWVRRLTLNAERAT
ncbi:MAG: type II secretion system F family protein [Ancrocorticia sp.]|uniref:type II secretion system F family protein n=1 Tax=Ancrocorticia sp. TaxID=2593684 RepID=UPI003F934951